MAIPTYDQLIRPILEHAENGPATFITATEAMGAVKALAATERSEQLRQSTNVDWQVRDTVLAHMRLVIKPLLTKYKYPAEGREKAVVCVLRQTEELANDWSN